MSLLDRAARRLAGREGSVDAGAPLTRRELVAAGAVAVGTAALLGPLPRPAAAATADDYCYPACAKAAADRLAAEKTRMKALLIRIAVQPGDSRLLALHDCVYLYATHYAQYYDNLADCKTPNCGDPAKYPPPAPDCGAPCPSGSSCQPCPTTSGGGVCCLDIFPLKNGKSQCCSS